MSDQIYYGPGTTPRKVAEAVERAKEARRDEGRRAPSTNERERFFQQVAELGKRARGE